MRELKVACIQINSGLDWRRNVNRSLKMSEEAVSKGVKMLGFPEHFAYLGRDYAGQAKVFRSEVLAVFSAFCKRHRAAIVLGTLPEPCAKKGRTYNTTYVIDAAGKIMAMYRKRRLFHADLGVLKGPSFSESDTFSSGDQGAAFSFRGFSMGLAICFDLRFPEIFTAYRDQGVDVIWLPAAFAYQTGQAHWEVLLRARAIENQCYVIAPNQVGVSATGAKYFGSSMIIDPWGRVVQKAEGARPALLTTIIRKAQIRQTRATVCMRQK